MGNPVGGGSEAEQTEGFAGAGGVIPTRFGDVLGTGKAQDADGQVAQGRHHVGAVAGADLGEILMKGDIAHMVATVFNLPMSTGHTQQVFRSGSIRGQAGESEGVIIPAFATFQIDRDPLDQECLTQVRKVDARSLGSDDDFTTFKAAMADVNGFGAEGGNRPKGGMSGGCEVFADSL